MAHPVPYWYVYITDATEDLYGRDIERAMRFSYPVVRNVVRIRRPAQIGMFASDLGRAAGPRLRGARPLVKDPFALFSSEWFASRYDTDVVVTVRQPVAFVGSIKRLGWGFKFKSLLAQGALVRDLLEPFERDMRRCRDQDVDIVEQGIVLWNVIHHAIAVLRERHPEWSFVRHEDLARAPVVGFARLYRTCGLRWDDRVATRIASFSSADTGAELPMWRHGSVKRDSTSATETWQQRLSEDEARRVRAGTAEIAETFYGDD